jgi:hypothetical protein
MDINPENVPRFEEVAQFLAEDETVQGEPVGIRTFTNLTRWVTERITAREGGRHPPTTTEMTGTNRALNAARNGLKRQRQLLRNEKLADGNLFSRWPLTLMGDRLRLRFFCEIE